jgi:hypothetical protein
MALGALMTLPTPAQQRVADRGGHPDLIGAHSVGVPDGGPGMPFTGWSTTGGDLRIPHFVGIHAMQVLPLIAILLSQLGARVTVLRDARVRARLVRVSAATYAGLVGLVTWQALRGQPLIHPDVVTLAALAALVLATWAAMRAVVARGQARASMSTSEHREPVPDFAGR